MTAEDAKRITKEKVNEELEAIYMAIEGYAKLGTKALYFDQHINGLHPRTLKILEENGFSVVREKDGDKSIVYVDWH